MNVSNAITWLLARLSEPSTRLGIGSMVAGGWRCWQNPADVEGWSLLIAGLIGIVTKEGVRQSATPKES